MKIPSCGSVIDVIGFRVKFIQSFSVFYGRWTWTKLVIVDEISGQVFIFYLNGIDENSRSLPVTVSLVIRWKICANNAGFSFRVFEHENENGWWWVIKIIFRFVRVSMRWEEEFAVTSWFSVDVIILPIFNSWPFCVARYCNCGKK